jgi:hypothetical protein
MKAPKPLEMVGTIHLIINCHITEDLKPQKLEIFVGGTPLHLILCPDGILFMHLKVIWIHSRKTTDAGFSSDHLNSLQWMDSLTNLLVTMFPCKLPSDTPTQPQQHKDLVLCTEV